MEKTWQIMQPDISITEKIQAHLKCSPVIAAILANRNITSEKNALWFLKPSFTGIKSPHSIKDMDAAVKRIYSAITNHEKILIFGDYDVDGITATTIVLKFLRYVNADVSYYIPDRIKEGYGLQSRHIENFAAPNKTDLIITVDCGSSSSDAVKTAQSLGIDVIITDHHEISDNLPDYVTILNPKRNDCESGLDYLAGVGVAFYLLICLRKYMRDKNFWREKPEPNLKNVCDIVALGTVADMVPLVHENRLLVKTGLEIINSGNNCGIKALVKSSEIKNKSVNTGNIAFRLAPRLNAAGRIENASTAVELLTTDDPETAKKIASSLNNMNIKRQNIEKEIISDILKYLKKNQSILENSSLVLSDYKFDKMWHEGVLGIVASRLVKKYFRPVVVIAIKDGIGKGSARSIPGFNIYNGLDSCSDCLEAFGGHAMAAGLKIKAENMDTFQKNFDKTVEHMTTQDNFVQKVTIDCKLDFDDITDELINTLESLQPFGTGNREPVFMAENIRVINSKIVGKNHMQMFLKQSDSITEKSLKAVYFNADIHKKQPEYLDKIAFRLRWNHWNGNRTAQIIIQDVKITPQKDN